MTLDPRLLSVESWLGVTTQPSISAVLYTAIAIRSDSQASLS